MPIFREREVAFCLRRSRARVLFVPDEARGRQSRRRDRRDAARGLGLQRRPSAAARARDRLASGRKTHALPATDNVDAPVHWLRFQEALAPSRNRRRALDARRADPTALAQLLFTSGTSGEPKGVLHRNDVLMRAAAMEVEHLGLSGEDRIFVPSPLAHQTGFLYGMWLAIVMGVPQITSTRLERTARAARAQRLGRNVRASRDAVLSRSRAGGRRRRTPAGGAADLRRDRRRRAARIGRTRDAHSRHGGLRRVGHDRILSRIAFRAERRSRPKFGERTAARCAASGFASPTRKAARCPPARRVTSRCTRRRCSRAMPIIPNGRRRPSPAMDGFAPATSASWTNPDTSASRVACATSSIAAAKKFRSAEMEQLLGRSSGDRRGRDRRDAGSRGSANAPAPSSCCATGARLDFDRMQHYLDACQVAKHYWPERLEIVAELPRTPSGKVQKYVLRERARDAAALRRESRRRSLETARARRRFRRNRIRAAKGRDRGLRRGTRRGVGARASSRERRVPLELWEELARARLPLAGRARGLRRPRHPVRRGISS